MANIKTFVLAGGCFWCLDAAYRVLKGVKGVDSVYTGGETDNPTYEQICTGSTGHAEAVRVTFDADTVPEDTILDAFFTMHDPTQLNRQGNDIGTQYRSAMFYEGEEQLQIFLAARDRAAKIWSAKIETVIEPLGEVFMAEDYHQDFFANNPTQAYCLAVALPKVMQVRREFSKYLR